ASEQVRAEARRHADRCRDELAAENLAALVPPNVMGYIELRKPMALVCSLAEAVGLAGRDIREALGTRPDVDSNLQFNIPKQITLSPSPVEALSSFGSMAIAITDVRGDEPQGVLILHHGNASLIKGLLETGIQFAPTARKIAGLPTFKFEDKAI